MTKLDSEKIQRAIHQAAIAKGWATEADLQGAWDARQANPALSLELYLRQQRIITERQCDELRLFHSMVDNIAGYQIDGIVGAGAMGVVYLASDQEGRSLALKVINKKHCDDEEFIKRFERETHAVSTLEHPHIVAAVGSGNVGEELYLATEYVDGPSMSEILEHFGPLPEAYVLQCMRQVCDGLDHAYKTSGVVHRDIKPPNILIDHGANSSKSDCEPKINQDTAKIIDFGLAKKTDDTDNLTLTGLTVGTPHYMAPEQIRADPKIDCRADIYSLGATMYHLLTGSTPFKGNSPGAIMLAHVNDEIPDPSDIIPSLHEETARLVRLSLAKDKEERYANYEALRQSIDQAIAACSHGQGSGMRVLRKPLVVKNKVASRAKKKKSEPQIEKANPQTQKVGPKNDAVTSRTERVDASDRGGKPVTEKGSSSMLRLVQQRLFSHKTSAAFDEDIDSSMGVSTWVWVALAASLIFMLITIVIRYGI